MGGKPEAEQEHTGEIHDGRPAEHDRPTAAGLPEQLS